MFKLDILADFQQLRFGFCEDSEIVKRLRVFCRIIAFKLLKGAELTCKQKISKQDLFKKILTKENGEFDIQFATNDRKA